MTSVCLFFGFTKGTNKLTSVFLDKVYYPIFCFFYEPWVEKADFYEQNRSD